MRAVWGFFHESSWPVACRTEVELPGGERKGSITTKTLTVEGLGNESKILRYIRVRLYRDYDDGRRHRDDDDYCYYYYYC